MTMITFFVAGFSFLYGMITLLVTSGLMDVTTQMAYHDPYAGVFCFVAGLLLFPLGGRRLENQMDAFF